MIPTNPQQWWRKGLVRRSLLLSWTVLLAVSTLGCGSKPTSQLPVFPASGTITFEGTPLDGARLQFHPTSPLEVAEGSQILIPAAHSTEDGTFVVHTYTPGDGIPEGDYTVTVSCDDRERPVLDRFKKPVRGEFQELLPARYQDPKQSNLKVSITSGPNDLEEFKLTR